jgi:hypothetical protein
MIQNYILESRLKVTIGRFMKTSFWLSLIIFVVELFFILVVYLSRPTIFLTNFQLCYIVIISFIPIFLFIFSFYIYENFYILRLMNNLIKLKSFLWILFLVFPNLFLIFRFSGIDYVIILSTLTLFIPVVGFGNTDKLKPFAIFFDVKYIMNDFWIKQNNEFEKNHFVNNIQSVRQDLYEDNKGIKLFQDTISCPVIDAKAAYKLIENDLKGTIKILDIGGAEGRFTKELLSCYLKITGNLIKNITCVDPILQEEEYKNNLKNIVKNVDDFIFVNSRIQNLTLTSPQQYDLVIVSHSLYSAIDNSESQSNTLSNLLVTLNTYKKEKTSKIIIILASIEGRAYSFKKHSLDLLFGKIPTDANANQLKIHSHNLPDCKSLLVDNLIDLTALMKEYDLDNPVRLKQWLSYFLRVNLSLVDNQTFERIVKLLKFYIQPFHELAECEINDYVNTNSLPYDRNHTLVLTHKSEIFVL